MKIIFHMPENIFETNASGPTVRPRRFIEAFKEQGIEVFLCVGTLNERKKQYLELVKKISLGEKFDFMYSESSSYPTLWTESQKSLWGPKVDFTLFKLCKKEGIPVGIYLRDIYWTSMQFKKESSLLKRLIFTLLHEIDLIQYRKYTKILYLQSKLMGESLPHSYWFNLGVLPPGISSTNTKQIKVGKYNSNKHLKLFYVGGIDSHYNMDVVYEALKKLEGKVELTLCCRKRDIALWGNPAKGLTNVNIIHKNADEIAPFIEESDITLLYFEPGEYRRFVMPNKLYEYITYKRPIISNIGTEAGTFVKQNNIGWAIDYSTESFISLIHSIIDNNNILMSKVNNFEKVIATNTWAERVKRVIADLV